MYPRWSAWVERLSTGSDGFGAISSRLPVSPFTQKEMSLGHVKTTEHLTGKRPAGDELFAPEAHPYAPCSLNLDASPADKLSTPLTDHPELTIKRTWSFAGHSQDPLCVEYRYTPRTTTSLVVWILWTMTSSGFAFALQKHGSDWVRFSSSSKSRERDILMGA